MKRKLLREKLEKLKDYIRSLEKSVLAYSGGVDSTLLLKVSSLVLSQDNFLAVIGDSPTLPKKDKDFALYMVDSLGVNYKIIKTEEMACKNFIRNYPDRCYWCKYTLFSEIKKIAKDYKYRYVIEGSNYDDLKDYRPGFKAKEKLGVLSPLLECKINKEEIRRLSFILGLPSWNKSSSPCLSSRIPYYSPITKDTLQRIEQSEIFISQLGFRTVRVRDYQDTARIEVDKKDFSRILNEKTREKIIEYLHGLGYKYITLDLEGYRQGSMNIVLKDSNEK